MPLRITRPIRGTTPRRPEALKGLNIPVDATRPREYIVRPHVPTLPGAMADIDALLATLPSPGQALHGVLPPGVSLANLLWPLIDWLTPFEPCPELVIFTLSMSIADAEHLAQLVQSGRVRKLTVVISYYFTRATGDVGAACMRVLEPAGARLVVARTHAKLLLIKSQDRDTPIVVESSANIRQCECYEQVVIHRSRAVYDFHASFAHLLSKTKDAQTARSTPTTRRP